MNRILLLGTVWIAMFCHGGLVRGDEFGAGEPEFEPDESNGLLNWTGPTLGGKQFWSDELVYLEWRIQRNFYTGHYRLLDDKNIRRAWGDFEHCRRQLDRHKQQLGLPPLQGPVVILMHGLCRSRTSMARMGEYLQSQGDFQIVNVSYASTRADVGAHAASLARVIENLQGASEIHFVAHSLGNLVIRHYLADHTDPQTGLQPDPRIGRIVMLGPPNNGTQLANTFRNNHVYKLVWGISGKQLASEWDVIENKLATPRCEFGIIAGGQGNARGHNPWLAGDDDMVVSVAETRLPGARDFIIVPVLHSSLMRDTKVQQYTRQFLEHGHFVSEDRRQPIPVDAEPQ